MRLMTIPYKVAATKENEPKGRPAMPERRDEAVVIETGCGFAQHLSITMWGGEYICTMSTTGGHAFNSVITRIKADSPIEVKEESLCGCGSNEKIFRSWLEEDLVTRLIHHRFLSERVIE